MIHWNPDPILFSFGVLTVHWYGLLFASVFLLGFKIMQRIYIREGRAPSELERLLPYVVLGVIVGARLAHCLFYDPQFYLSHPLEILKVWKGGLASHGGGLGLLLALIWFVRKTPGLDYLWLIDRMAIPTALGGCFIRIANLINSEIIGIPTRASWGVIFERIDHIPRHPVQLYEAGAYLMIFIALLTVYLRYTDRLRRGLLIGIFLISVFTARFLLEFLKTHQAVQQISDSLSMGQLLSLPFILAGLIFVVRAALATHDRRRSE